MWYVRIYIFTCEYIHTYQLLQSDLLIPQIEANRAGWNIPMFNRKYIFQWTIFHCYVSLPEGICIHYNWGGKIPGIRVVVVKKELRSLPLTAELPSHKWPLGELKIDPFSQISKKERPYQNEELGFGGWVRVEYLLTKMIPFLLKWGVCSVYFQGYTCCYIISVKVCYMLKSCTTWDV